MLRVAAATVALFGAPAAAQCPNAGFSAHDRCWYLSDAGASCKATCSAQGLQYSHFTAPEASPIVPSLLNRNPATKQFAWGRLECYVPGDDRYHAAQAVAASNTGDNGEAGDWSVSVCRLSCPCGKPADMPADFAFTTEAFPACVKSNVVLRHAGAHAIFVDLSAYGSAGCWQNDCKNSDKFNAEDVGICARTCAAIDECTHWSHGEQDGAKKCFFRKADGGREQAEGWMSAIKACAPSEIPAAQAAKAAAQVVSVCDAGKSDACPDMARAVTTWKFAINQLKKATQGQLDANMMQYINQIGTDTDAFAAQMSEENFPIVMGNNRQVFIALESWMSSQTGVQINPNDASLPAPLRGSLCGPSSCHEKV